MRVGQPTSQCCGTVCEGKVRERTMMLARLSPHFLSLPLFPIKGLCPFRCWFLGEWVCVCSRTPWVPPTDSPVRLGISPTTTTRTDFYSQRFWGFVPLHWGPGLHSLSCSTVIPPSLSAWESGKSHPPATASPTPVCCHLALRPLCPSYQSGWMFLL